MSSDFIDASDIRRSALERLAALKDVLALVPSEDRPLSASDVIAYADWIATGTPDVAQGNDRVSSQNYKLGGGS